MGSIGCHLGQPVVEGLPPRPRTSHLAPTDELLERERARPGTRVVQDDLPYVLASHAEDEVGTGDERTRQSAAAVGRDVDAARLEGGDRLGGGGRSAAEQPGRVDARLDAEPVQPIAEQTLGHWRAADVRRADQEDVDPGSVPAPLRRLRLPGAGSPAVTRRFTPP